MLEGVKMIMIIFFIKKEVRVASPMFASIKMAKIKDMTDRTKQNIPLKKKKIKKKNQKHQNNNNSRSLLHEQGGDINLSLDEVPDSDLDSYLIFDCIESKCITSKKELCKRTIGINQGNG